MVVGLTMLGKEGLRRLQLLRADAVCVVTERLYAALGSAYDELAGHQREALSIVNDCIDVGHGLFEAEQHVIKPSLHHIGEKWQANQVTVVAEHLATAIAQLVMTVGLLRSTPPTMIGRRVLLACVAGNLHCLGQRYVRTRGRGWGADGLR